jgi:hypothetical protein
MRDRGEGWNEAERAGHDDQHDHGRDQEVDRHGV